MKKEENNTQQTSDWPLLKLPPFILPDLSAHLIFWPLVIFGTALDLWTKKAVFNWLEHGNSASIIDGFLQFVMALNNGAAFGLFAGHPYWLISVSVIALIGILGIFFFGGISQRLVYVVLGLFAAGVCGNLYDRVFNDGHVRDFIDVTIWSGRHWPAFNIADSMLCIAVGLGIISCFYSPKSTL